MSESAVNFDSYPPVFRRLKHQTHNFDTVGAVNQVPDSDPIPVIDLQCLDLDLLGKVCRDWGLFRLVNHGVPPTLLSQLQDHAKKLFSLSFESKQAIFRSPLSYFWGTPVLTPSGAALQIGPQNVNWVEGLNVPLGQLFQLQAEDPGLASFRYTFYLLVLFFLFLVDSCWGAWGPIDYGLLNFWVGRNCMEESYRLDHSEFCVK